MSNDQRAEQLVQLLTQHNRRLAAYVITLVRRSVDASRARELGVSCKHRRRFRPALRIETTKP